MAELLVKHLPWSLRNFSENPQSTAVNFPKVRMKHFGNFSDSDN